MWCSQNKETSPFFFFIIIIRLLLTPLPFELTPLLSSRRNIGGGGHSSSSVVLWALALPWQRVTSTHKKKGMGLHCVRITNQTSPAFYSFARVSQVNRLVSLTIIPLTIGAKPSIHSNGVGLLNTSLCLCVCVCVCVCGGRGFWSFFSLIFLGRNNSFYRVDIQQTTTTDQKTTVILCR
jgi:hypothetical protein